jgi:DNA-binding transcriptional MocR family regulator
MSIFQMSTPTFNDGRGARRPLPRALLKNHKTQWLRRFDQMSGSIYLRIFRAMEEAIRTGELQPGDQIPPQRTVAEILGVDFTTVTRAYAAARDRGLVEGTVGRGTFVATAPAPDTGFIKMTMNHPPAPQGMSLAKLMRESTQAILDRTDMSGLMMQQEGQGGLGQRIAGAMWVEPTMGKINPDRVLVCGGIQIALAAILATIAEPGDVLVTESLTHPAMVNLARFQHMRVVACPSDDDGLIPEDLARICAEERPRAVFTIPTLHPATTVTMSVARRRAIAEVCRAADVLIIEDDAYGRIPAEPTPAVATFAPERTFYVAGLSKTLMDMRHGFLIAPDEQRAADVAWTFRHFDIHPSPLTSAVLTGWIRDGGIEPIIEAVRAESRQRRSIASVILPEAKGPPDAFHVWMDLPAGCDNAGLTEAARAKGLLIITADKIACNQNADYPNGLRVALGGPASQAELIEGLQTLRTLLATYAA